MEQVKLILIDDDEDCRKCPYAGVECGEHVGTVLFEEAPKNMVFTVSDDEESRDVGANVLVDGDTGEKFIIAPGDLILVMLLGLVKEGIKIVEP